MKKAKIILNIYERGQYSLEPTKDYIYEFLETDFEDYLSQAKAKAVKIIEENPEYIVEIVQVI